MELFPLEISEAPLLPRVVSGAILVKAAGPSESELSEEDSEPVSSSEEEDEADDELESEAASSPLFFFPFFEEGVDPLAGVV